MNASVSASTSTPPLPTAVPSYATVAMPPPAPTTVTTPAAITTQPVGPTLPPPTTYITSTTAPQVEVAPQPPPVVQVGMASASVNASTGAPTPSLPTPAPTPGLDVAATGTLGSAKNGATPETLTSAMFPYIPVVLLPCSPTASGSCALPTFTPGSPSNLAIVNGNKSPTSSSWLKYFLIILALCLLGVLGYLIYQQYIQSKPVPSVQTSPPLLTEFVYAPDLELESGENSPSPVASGDYAGIVSSPPLVASSGPLRQKGKRDTAQSGQSPKNSQNFPQNPPIRQGAIGSRTTPSREANKDNLVGAQPVVTNYHHTGARVSLPPAPAAVPTNVEVGSLAGPLRGLNYAELSDNVAAGQPFL